MTDSPFPQDMPWALFAEKIVAQAEPGRSYAMSDLAKMAGANLDDYSENGDMVRLLSASTWLSTSTDAIFDVSLITIEDGIITTLKPEEHKAIVNGHSTIHNGRKIDATEVYLRYTCRMEL